MIYSDKQKYQISVDYQKAMRNCNETAWTKMTVDEKVQDLQSIENYHAMQQNRLAADVSAEPMEADIHGKSLGNSIVISKTDLEGIDYKECIDTVYHEGEHVYFNQGKMFSGIRQQMEQEFSQEEIQQIQSPIPNAELDYSGYYGHLNETLARMEGEKGVLQADADWAAIKGVDANMPHQNQILETYDYDALAISTENQCETQGHNGYNMGGKMANGEVSSASMGRAVEGNMPVMDTGNMSISDSYEASFGSDNSLSLAGEDNAAGGDDGGLSMGDDDR